MTKALRLALLALVRDGKSGELRVLLLALLVAVSALTAESLQARTMLQRVVVKRSGDRLPSLRISGVTVCDHRIYETVGKLKGTEVDAYRDRGRSL